MKITVHIICTKRNVDSKCPAILELKSLQEFFSSMGDTAVHTDSGPRSRKTKWHNQRQLLKAAEGGVYRRAMMALSSKYVFHRKRYPCV